MDNQNEQPAPADGIDPEAVRRHLQQTYGFPPDTVEKIFAAARRTLDKDFDFGLKALAEEDLASLRKSAHSIKGSLASLGLSALAEEARRIEKQEVVGDAPPLTTMGQAFQALLRAVRPLLP